MTSIDRSQLLKTLDKVRHTAASSRIVPLYQCFCFQDGFVSCYNGQAGTRTPCDLGGEDFAIEAGRFYKLVAALPGDMVELSFGKQRLNISSGSNRTWMMTLSTRGFPEFVPDSSKVKSFDPPENLATALNQALFTAGENAMKPELLGIAIRGRHVYSSDSHRVTRVLLDAEVALPLKLPTAVVAQMTRLGKPQSMACTENLLVSSYEDGTVLSTRLLEGEFPFDTVDSLLVGGDPNYSVILPEGLTNAVHRVQIMATSDDPDIVLESTGEALVIRSQDVKAGEAEERLPWECQHKFKFASRPVFLLAALNRSIRVSVFDIVRGSARSILFATDGFDHILALMQMKEA